jgi:lysozyme
MNKARVIVASLTLSAAAFIGLVAEEGYVGQAMIPTKGDRPTIGFGSTFHEDGRPVKMGETTTPTRALVLAQKHVSKEEVIFRKSLEGASLQQGEFDLYMKFTYQYGTGNWVKSAMRTKILAGDYKGACDALLQYRFAAGYDCSTMVNGKRNTRCWGVWERQQQRHSDCMALQA